MTPESLDAIARLRSPDHFEWTVVVGLAFVVSVYASNVRRGHLDRVVLALGFWAVEFLWEMVNALVLHFSGFSALWTVAGDSALVIYVGLTLEIAFLFGVAPLVLFDLLPEDRTLRVMGMPVRVLVPVLLGLFCVAVECVLYAWGGLVWAWWFWKWPNILPIALVYCVPFVALVWIHDHTTPRARAIGSAVAVVAAIAAHAVLAVGLGWI